MAHMSRKELLRLCCDVPSAHLKTLRSLMRRKRTVTLQVGRGNKLRVTLYPDLYRQATVLHIDGIPHHFERLKRADLTKLYQVDTDPDYRPKTDRRGYCYMLVPFSK